MLQVAPQTKHNNKKIFASMLYKMSNIFYSSSLYCFVAMSGDYTCVWLQCSCFLKDLCYSYMFSFGVIFLARVLPFLFGCGITHFNVGALYTNLVKIIYNPIWCWGPTELSDLCSASVEDQTCDLMPTKLILLIPSLHSDAQK